MTRSTYRIFSKGGFNDDDNGDGEDILSDLGVRCAEGKVKLSSVVGQTCQKSCRQKTFERKKNAPGGALKHRSGMRHRKGRRDSSSPLFVFRWYAGCSETRHCTAVPTSSNLVGSTFLTGSKCLSRTNRGWTWPCFGPCSTTRQAVVRSTKFLVGNRRLAWTVALETGMIDLRLGHSTLDYQ